jgi:hypothetical protein
VHLLSGASRGLRAPGTQSRCRSASFDRLRMLGAPKYKCTRTNETLDNLLRSSVSKGHPEVPPELAEGHSRRATFAAQRTSAGSRGAGRRLDHRATRGRPQASRQRFSLHTECRGAGHPTPPGPETGEKPRLSTRGKTDLWTGPKSLPTPGALEETLL